MRYGLGWGSRRRRDSKRGSAGNELTVATDGDGVSSLISPTPFLAQRLGFPEEEVGGVAVSHIPPTYCSLWPPLPFAAQPGIPSLVVQGD